MGNILKDLDPATQKEVAQNMRTILDKAKTKEGKTLTDGFGVKDWLKNTYIEKNSGGAVHP